MFYLVLFVLFVMALALITAIQNPKRFRKVLKAGAFGPMALLFSATGPVYSGSFDTERKSLDVKSQIARLAPKASIFTTILLNISKRTTDQERIYWYEQDPVTVMTPSRGGDTSSATELKVDDSTIFSPKDILGIVSSLGLILETCIVASITTTENANTVTVSARAWTGTAQTISDDQWIVNLGPAMEENSQAPTSRVSQPVKCENYIQELRLPFDASLLANLSMRTSENERTRLTTEKTIEFKRMIERVSLFGKKKDDYTAAKKRAMGGILEYISTNSYDAGGVLTESAFDVNFCEPVFKYDKDDLLLVCGPRLVTVINSWGKAKLQTTSKEETYGMELQYYQSAHGRIILAPSLELANTAWNGLGVGLHMKRVELVSFKDAGGTYDGKLDRNIQENDRHGWKDEIWGMYTICLENEKAHGIIKGVTG